jgi:ATP-binding cassette subfamily B protein
MVFCRIKNQKLLFKVGSRNKQIMTSFPFYRQHDTMQCGITCLRMLCKYYGKDFSIETLSQYCFVTNEGVSLLGIC